MSPKAVARFQRTGGVHVAPGRTAQVRLGLPDEGDRWSVGAWIAVGREPGPRVSVVAGVRGCELAATLAARSLMDELDPNRLRGSLLVVPLMRPGDRFARPGRVEAPLLLPGDAGGRRRERLAFALHAELVVAAQHVIELGGPSPARTRLLTIEGSFDDPRLRKLAMASGAAVRAEDAGAEGSWLAAARLAGRVALRLSAGGGDDEADAILLKVGLRRMLAALGLYPTEISGGEEPRVVNRLVAVTSSADGVLLSSLRPGDEVTEGGVLGRCAPAAGGTPLDLLSPVAGVVVEAPSRSAVRRGARLFLVGELPPTDMRPRSARTPSTRAPATAPERVRAGWLERVSLPDLGLGRVPAKIDTGARTSALHVSSSRVVGRVGGPHRRPILELKLMAPGRRAKLVVRVPVREFVEVRDTSGRIERRPVIETTLELGSLRRRIRLTLTNRGDMRCPMLVGRSALGGAVVVDPGARYLLRIPPAPTPKAKSRAHRREQVSPKEPARATEKEQGSSSARRARVRKES